MPGGKKQRTWDGARTAAENVRNVLPGLTARFYQAGRKAAHTELSHRKLHRFRLKAKRFRYTLELFQGFYGPSFGQLLTGLREIQNHLGKMSDCVSMEALFEAEPKLASAARRRATKHAAEFKTYWKDEFDGEGEEERWVRYLGRAMKGAQRAARKKDVKQ